MRVHIQKYLFDPGKTCTTTTAESSSTFIDNMKLPVHRWFRYSAGFSGRWAEAIIAENSIYGETRVLDPFAGSGTTLIASEDVGVPCYGIEAHPFIFRIGKAKLARRSSVDDYRSFALNVLKSAKRNKPTIDSYPELIKKCFEPDALCGLDQLRQLYEKQANGADASELTWLTLAGILRKVSHVGTAQWQYILPKKSKKNHLEPFVAFREQIDTISKDMTLASGLSSPNAILIQSDARTCIEIPTGYATLIITSPPYTNNYDYADATRLEMTFMGEIAGWGELQGAVRKYLVRSCSQHVPNKSINLDQVLHEDAMTPIRSEIEKICGELSEVRKTKGGKKTYHLMIACYFLDMAQVWRSLRRVCDSPSRVCFVIGDSAPYGIYVPVVEWMGQLALAAGFRDFSFEKTRDRNVKWKNRKHRVPLCEGRLWVNG
jgi:hypothetical protein